MKHLLTILLTTLTITSIQAQNYRWAHGFGTSNGDSHGTGIATDAQGNVYATGFFADSIDFDPSPLTAYVASNIPGQQAMYVAKYDSAGIYQWAFGIDGYYYLGDPHIAVNATGVYVTGCFVNTTDFDPSASVANLTAAGFTDIFLAKYDLNGNYQWAINMGGVDIDISNAIAIDNVGNSYITGYFKDTIADFDPGIGVANVTSHGVYNIFCGKYDINGNYQWAFGFGEGTVLNEGRSISVDQTGVVISGLFTDTIDIDPGVGSTILYSSQNVGGFLVKYNNFGIYQWGFALGGALYSSMIEANGNGGVYACGIFGTDTMDFDPGNGVVNLATANGGFFMAKYDVNGNYLLANNTGGPSGMITVPQMYQDVNGNLYIVGRFFGTFDFDPGLNSYNLSAFGTFDILFSKYDSNFNFYWARNMGGQYFDWGQSIALDVSGSIYLTGYFTNSMDADPDMGVATLFPATGENIFIAKYDNTLTNILNSNPNEIAELAVYPNPATDHLQISFTKEIECQIIISNAIGQAVYTQTIQNQSCAQTNLTGYPAGVYYVKVWGKGFSSYKRIVVVG